MSSIALGRLSLLMHGPERCRGGPEGPGAEIRCVTCGLLGAPLDSPASPCHLEAATLCGPASISWMPWRISMTCAASLQPGPPMRELLEGGPAADLSVGSV